ncbi:RNA ligase [Halogeometricum borinquense]|uniref:RNA ligase n=1 Tax=Halogeometricum borinquense TaxID=60847 RepID=A0A6C0UK33_9EURY|nr:RNA ligase [Halogeometricum borinquense]QIB75587.1 RNA ligase [Halogeometricum borinquense]
MDDREYFERLESTAETPDELFEHFSRRSIDGRTYYVLSDARHGVERGTVVVEAADAVVRGYPSIPRVLVLDSGVAAFFDDDQTVVAEEKLNGFNVRIADVGEPLAFTKGGHVCPYTTSRVRDLLDLSSFFADYPKMMLCAELIGPETPYTTHDYEGINSNAVRVFGIRNRATGEPLPVESRRDLCDEYGFPQPRLFGWYSQEAVVEGVREAISELDDAGREGVVMKSADGTEMIKYTTESHHHDELVYAFSLPFDRGRDFFFSRVIREAFQAVEFGEDDERLRDRAHDLGESVLLPAVETIREVQAGKTAGERHTVRGDSESIDALLDHLRNHSLTVEIESDRHEDGERIVEFVKVAESTMGRTQYFLDGGTYNE